MNHLGFCLLLLVQQVGMMLFPSPLCSWARRQVTCPKSHSQARCLASDILLHSECPWKYSLSIPTAVAWLVLGWTSPWCFITTTVATPVTGHLLHASHCAKCSIFVNTVNPLRNQWETLFPFYRRWKGGTSRLRNLPEVTQLEAALQPKSSFSF